MALWIPWIDLNLAGQGVGLSVGVERLRHGQRVERTRARVLATGVPLRVVPHLLSPFGQPSLTTLRLSSAIILLISAAHTIFGLIRLTMEEEGMVSGDGWISDDSSFYGTSGAS